MIDLYDILWRVREFIDSVKTRWQRIVRGYSDTDVWNIDFRIMSLTAKMVRKLNEKTNSHPPLKADGTPMTDADWHDVLDDIAFAAEMYIGMYNEMCFCKTREQYDLIYSVESKISDDVPSWEDAQKATRGLQSFKDYFQNLWD